MSGQTYSHQADLVRWFENPTMTSMQLREHAMKSAQEIRLLYDSGRPFFTKDWLKQVSAQLQKGPQQGQYIHIMAVDGRMVPFEVETGRILPHDTDDRLEFVVGDPFIDYLSVQELVNPNRRPGFNCYTPKIAYCNQVLFHKKHLRIKITKEFILPRLPESIEQVSAKLDYLGSRWSATEAHNDLRTILTRTAQIPRITQIIGFALGTMEGEISKPWVQRSCLQHTLVLWLKDILQRQQENNISCWLQDPNYADSDKSTLLKHGVNVTESPDGFLKVDDNTLILSFGAEIPVHQIISAIAKPAILIWEKYEYLDEAAVMIGAWLDQDCPRLRQMYEESYDMFDVTSDGDCFRRTAVYVKRCQG